MSDKPSFFTELKRRNVYKVAIAYAVKDPRFQKLIAKGPLEPTPAKP